MQNLSSSHLGEHLDIARAIVSANALGPDGTALATVWMGGALRLLQLDLIVATTGVEVAQVGAVEKPRRSGAIAS